MDEYDVTGPSQVDLSFLDLDNSHTQDALVDYPEFRNFNTVRPPARRIHDKIVHNP
jgi:hypothetical protein